MFLNKDKNNALVSNECQTGVVVLNKIWGGKTQMIKC